MMGLSDDPGCIDGAFQITGYHHIEGHIHKILTYLLSLTNAILCEFTLCLSLHDLIDIIHRFTMPD